MTTSPMNLTDIDFAATRIVDILTLDYAKTKTLEDFDLIVRVIFDNQDRPTQLRIRTRIEQLIAESD